MTKEDGHKYPCVTSLSLTPGKMQNVTFTPPRTLLLSLGLVGTLLGPHLSITPQLPLSKEFLKI